MSLTPEEFEAKAKAVHGDTYDYSKVKYVPPSTKVEITTPEGDTFELSASDHRNGRARPTDV